MVIDKQAKKLAKRNFTPSHSRGKSTSKMISKSPVYKNEDKILMKFNLDRIK